MSLRVLEFSFWVLEFPYLIFFGFLGAVFGSFGKVLLDRMPIKESLTKPSSCPDCNRNISFFENLPLVSYILLRGKCRGCDKKIPISYFFIEFGFFLVFSFMWWLNQDNILIGLFHSLVIWLFWVIALYDWETLEIPDSFTMGMLPFVLIFSFLIPSMHGGVYTFNFWESMYSIKSSILGILISSGLAMWLGIFLNKYMSWRQKQEVEVFGFGDVKLLGLIGGILGVSGSVFSLLLGNILFIFMYIISKCLGIRREPHILMVTACDDFTMIQHVKKVVSFMKLNQNMDHVKLEEVIEILEDPDSLDSLFYNLENKESYIKNLLKDYKLHKESLKVATEMSEPMPLGPSLVVSAIIYIFWGEYFMGFMSFQ